MIFYTVLYTMQAASLAGVNQGVIASIFSCSIIFSAFLFYFFFDESLTKRHVIGIILMTASVVLISIGGSSSSEEIPEPETVDPIVVAAQEQATAD